MLALIYVIVNQLALYDDPHRGETAVPALEKVGNPLNLDLLPSSNNIRQMYCRDIYRCYQRYL